MNVKEEAATILKNWIKYVDYLEETDLERFIDKRSTHEEFISYLDNKPFINKELIKEICKQNSEFLLMNDIKIADFCSEELRNDFTTALEMVKTNANNLELVSEKFKDDKAFILKALEEANVLQYASERLRDDDEVVYLAVQKNPKTIVFASERFQTNKSFILGLLKKDNYIIEYIHHEIRSDIEFMLDCWKILYERNHDASMVINYHAKTLIRYMNDDLKPLFSQVNLELDNRNLGREMNACFNQYILNKELNEELNPSSQQPKKLKI